MTRHHFNVTLPQEMAEIVEDKVRSNAYDSASDVMRDGLRALFERDIALDRWLAEEVAEGHAEYLADPAKAVPIDTVLARIKAKR